MLSHHLIENILGKVLNQSHFDRIYFFPWGFLICNCWKLEIKIFWHKWWIQARTRDFWRLVALHFTEWNFFLARFKTFPIKELWRGIQGFLRAENSVCIWLVIQGRRDSDSAIVTTPLYRFSSINFLSLVCVFFSCYFVAKGFLELKQMAINFKTLFHFLLAVSRRSVRSIGLCV